MVEGGRALVTRCGRVGGQWVWLMAGAAFEWGGGAFGVHTGRQAAAEHVEVEGALEELGVAVSELRVVLVHLVPAERSVRCRVRQIKFEG